MTEIMFKSTVLFVLLFGGSVHAIPTSVRRAPDPVEAFASVSTPNACEYYHEEPLTCQYCPSEIIGGIHCRAFRAKACEHRLCAVSKQQADLSPTSVRRHPNRYRHYFRPRQPRRLGILRLCCREPNRERRHPGSQRCASSLQRLRQGTHNSAQPVRLWQSRTLLLRM